VEVSTRERCHPGLDMAGGVAAMRPPLQCQRHCSRSLAHPVVLHDCVQLPAPARPGTCHRPCWCRSLANGTEHDQDFISKLTYRGL
jgi:hypothetical protein